MSERRRTTSGSPFEEKFGFCRAVREGNRIIVAGTGPIEDDGSSTSGDAAAQAARCCTLVVKAIEARDEAGAEKALKDHISKAFVTRLKLDAGS